ncbi:MAG: HAD-IB family hydrolase [Alphaproteobacteria bacterium]|nr:HAD-IB family hydrolase [Alphaproteobacteria bacterium]
MQPPSSETGPVIAVFDFDHTLVKHDSFWSFLAYVVGWRRTIRTFLESLLAYAGRWAVNSYDRELRDKRTFIKSYLLRHLLAGRSLDELAPAIERLRRRQRWKEDVRQRLMEHYARGHHIVIASGGLDIYLKDLLQGVPYHGLICTVLERNSSGKITGVMSSGNCVRQRKADLVAAYIAAHGPFADSWGYGNLPHDVPMLQLVQHPVTV